MSWAAANLPRRQENNEDAPAKSKESKRRGETVEAVLSRLSKSYSLAMECLGAMHEANAAIVKRKPEDIDDASLQSLRKVAVAARNMLERTILIDPLIVEHSPCLRNTIRQFADNKGPTSEKWKALCAPRPEPPKISSKAHRATIQQLAYLSLTNYADLLVSCCTCCCGRIDHAKNSDKLLDRGVVKKLQGFSDNFAKMGCCWEDDEADIQRLALVAMSDASALDGSDPVVWLKLACAARAMGHLNALPDRLVNPMLSPFRRLERHALEKGYTALPPNVPPNRIISRLLNEFNNEQPPDLYPAVLVEQQDPVKLRLDLTRYSWASLGRLLMKACREGKAMEGDDTLHMNAIKNARIFPSPVISLNLSPMLLIPSNVLSVLLSFLENNSVWKLEATCRALSVSIMSVRAAIEKQGASTSKTQQGEPSTSGKPNVDQNNEEMPSNSQPAANNETDQGESGRGREEPSQQGGETSTRVGRSSKRVRSQQLSSDKKEERLRRRNSVEFCLRAATLSCTSSDEQYNASLKVPEAWDSFKGEVWKLPASLEGPSVSQKGKIQSLEESRKKSEASERTGPSSLSSFLVTWNSSNTGPIDMLLQYLGHVAVHVENVFLVDPADAMALTSCISGCFEVVLQRKCWNSLMPQFFDLEQEISKINLEQRLRLFATDVLHTEIRFKRCERHHDLYVDLDDDLNFVSWMVPNLLGGISQLDNDFTESAYEEDWIKIKARIFWLCAGVFLWRSRFTATAFESIEAEEEGLRYIESTISCLDLPVNSPIQVIPTPHLESPGRVGAHWKKLSHQSLAAYRDEIQASSVVSLAQQQFQERIATITKRNKDTDEISLTNEDIKDLSLIGDSLIARYKVPFGEKGCKLNELLDDFLSLFGDEYFSKSLNKGKELSRDQVVPSIIQVRKLAESSDLSILTILVACLRTKPENHGRISMLLIHLVLTSLDRHEQVCFSGQAGNGGDASPTEDLSDSEDDSMSDEGRVQGTGAGTMGYAITAMKCGRFAKFIIDCLRDSLISLEDDEKVKVSLSDAFVRMLHHSLAFCSNWVDHFSQQPAVIEECLDLDTFISIQKLLKSLPGPEAANDENSYLQQLYFRGLVRIICSQRRSFSSLVRVQGTVRARRAVRQRICIARARFIGTVFCDMGCLLSQNLSTIGTASMRRSTMVEISLSDALNSDSDVNWPIDLPRLCDALLWFWEYAGMSTSQLDASTGTSFDRPIIERLRIPLAAAILGFCGSASCTRKTMKTTPKRGAGIDDDDEPSDHLCLTEFFDSDASAREFSDSEEENEGNVTTEVVSSQRELLRAISHVIHCVGLVFGKMEEKEIVSFDRCDLYKTKHGPLLPLVASRILNHLADAILEHFRDDDDRDDNGIWSDSYPFATRSIGALLDSALYKAYKCLHGFTLTGSTDQHSIKDSILPTNADIEIDRFLPESTAAAARLYRCIIRARRRTPPSAALETVLAALPNLEMSEKTKKIHDFLFSTTSSRFNEEEIKMIVTKSSRWENLFEVVQEWELAANSSDVNNADHDLEDSSNDEVMRVRKGIFALLAQGDLPTYASSQGAKDDERSSAARFENELTKKFDAILKDLSYGDTTNIRSWLRAAQCCMLKAEAICDRLGMSKGFARSKGFHIPEEHPAHVSRQDIATLETKQEQEDEMRKLGCLDQIGDDLSLYIQHKWSNFDSLELLSEKLIGGAEASMDISVSQDEGGVFEHQVKKDISDMQKKGRLVEWQQAWGGMFVSALKKIAVRCMCLAFYFYHEHFEGMTTEDQGLLPELLESLGIKLYSDLSASQNYGYPMHVMTKYRKRRLAEASRVCFQSAVDLSRNVHENERDDDKETWDLLFMVGKCHEKIASTFKMERYDPDCAQKRMFEQHMEKALDNYQAALAEKPEETGEFGGSSHGVTEILYRLHATRLKCLLLGVDTHENERDISELEALRLTEKHWYSPPGDNDASESVSVRDRVWNVLSDVVSALAQCRLDKHFFHRSVYRHAQALMWAPVLLDPIGGRIEGSKGTVPATKSYHLRGLNHATNAATSALAVMSSLFEKKRTQLVAVWVTTSYPPSTFESLNDSVRKYDSLRGKYISAYIDSLRLCGKRNELETLLRWISSSKRDLPATFQATALTRGGRPEKSHNHDSLLVKGRSLSNYTLTTTLKRMANSALADVVLQELPIKVTKSIESELKLAYACFMRLNCSIHDIRKTRAWKYERGGVREVEALCEAFLKFDEKALIKLDPNDWSGGGKKAALLEAAVQKCRELFPTVSGNFYGKKAAQKPKNQTSETEKPGAEIPPTKQAGTKRSFEVAVPDGLSEGETFTTTIKSGENSKKVKLTVPSGNPRMLRFSLDLSSQTYD